MGVFIDLTGRRFGRLVVLRREPDPRNRRYWLCQCDCGRQKVIWAYSLTGPRGDTRSCGCLRREVHQKLFTKHGDANKPGTLYWTWCGMLDRCYRATSAIYWHYGGRGIRVCDRWHDYATFRADVGARPSASHSLDRVDNDGNYEPGNVRWATRKQQANNTRYNHRFEYNGEEHTLGEWADIVGIPAPLLCCRAERGWTAEMVLTRAVKRPRTLTHAGRTMTVKQWAIHLSIPKMTLESRLQRGWPTEKALSDPLRTQKTYTYGNRCMTLTEWAMHLGIRRGTLKRRIERGWPLERVLSHV